MLFKKKEEPEMVEREDGLIDYDVYVMTKEEKIINIIIAAVAIFAVGFVFYKSVILSAVLCLLAFKWPKIRVKQIIAKRKKELSQGKYGKLKIHSKLANKNLVLDNKLQAIKLI